MKLKIMAGALALLPFLMAGWWWLGATTQESALEDWMAERRAAGWQAEASAIDVNGFPNRLDATLRDPLLADPASGWSWSARRLDIRQVIYDPTFFVVEWPAEQRVAAPGAPATLRADVMEASFKIADDSTLGLIRSSLDIQRGAIAADAGWTAGVERLTWHIRQAPNAGPMNAYEFRLDAESLRLPEFIRRYADPAGALPQTLEAIALEGRAALDRPLDRFAFEGRKPQINALSLKGARAGWGPLSLALNGELRVDAEGYAAGELDVSARNWREMLDAAAAAGAMPEAFADTLKAGLDFVARLGRDRNHLDATLVFSGGYMKIGPVPIGPAPRLRD